MMSGAATIVERYCDTHPIAPAPNRLYPAERLKPRRESGGGGGRQPKENKTYVYGKHVFLPRPRMILRGGFQPRSAGSHKTGGYLLVPWQRLPQS